MFNSNHNDKYIKACSKGDIIKIKKYIGMVNNTNVLMKGFTTFLNNIEEFENRDAILTAFFSRQEFIRKYDHTLVEDIHGIAEFLPQVYCSDLFFDKITDGCLDIFDNVNRDIILLNNEFKEFMILIAKKDIYYSQLKIQRFIKQIRNGLLDCSKFAVNLKKNNDICARLSIGIGTRELRYNQLLRINTTIREQSEQFNQLVAANTTRYERRVKVNNFVRSDVDESEYQVMMVQRVDIKDRHEQIINLENDMMDLNEMFIDIQLLVSQQGETLDTIESHIDRTDRYVEDATENLIKANKLQKKSRWKKVLFWCVIAIVVGIIVTVIVV